MNAAEIATSPDTAQKIAAILSLCRQQFPHANANLNPWTNDADTLEWVDPHSIDIGFNLPAGNTLMQLRLHQHRLIGIEADCFGPLGSQRWRFSTIGEWKFLGSTPPPPEFQKKLKQVCHALFTLFNGSATLESHQ